MGQRGTPWTPDAVRIEALHAEVFAWFSVYGRDLPWRRTREPYRVLVSEFMLQQTQVSRVMRYFPAFLDRFPTAGDLATAPLTEVLPVWQGLGYNRRAVRLRDACRQVMESHDGVFPDDVASLRRLTGVGEYTALAVACFAFEAPVALVETNVRTMLGIFRGRLDVPENVADRALADAVLPPHRAWAWNQALMDMGADEKTRSRGGVTQGRTRADNNRVGGRTPFRETNRYWRGRIIAALCAHPAPQTVPGLLRALPAQHDEYRIRALLEAMSREGLLDLSGSGERVGLPRS